MPPQDSQIFKATYSGIPVYEMMCKGVAVMRRKSDSWLNATQILKVAGFDKPQRTRILEREVQKGEHEKVQGGYGKYQGTWIPVHRGLELAQHYGCETALMPIIDFTPAASSPPLAPKHLIATSTKPIRRDDSTPGITTRASRRAASVEEHESEEEVKSVRASEDGSMTPSPSEASSSSRTPSPIRSPVRDPDGGHRGRKSRRTQERYETQEEIHEYEEQLNEPVSYGEQVLEYFISDANQIPQFLIAPPPDFDPNIAIDDDGHTALHWAAAMGRVRIVKLLLTAGADIFKVNNAGQTALMRAVMFANNYDVRKFAELYELLHRSTLNIDHHNRTVFHHIVDVAMTKGKSHAARYYMETVLSRLGDYPDELADVVNFQDEDGETALTLAARCRSKRLVKLLIDCGANPKIANNDGKSAEDYILEDERFRMSPVPAGRAAGIAYRGAPPSQLGIGAASWTYAPQPSSASAAPLHTSACAQRASTKAVNEVATMLDGLAAAFEGELREKERDKTQAHALLAHIQQEILESQRTVQQLKSQAQGLAPARQTIRQLEEELTTKMARKYRQGWEQWVKEEEEREQAVKAVIAAKTGTASGTAHSANGTRADGFTPSVGTTVGSSEVSKGKRKAPLISENDLRIVEALHSEIPSDPTQLEAACNALREEVKEYQARRKGAFESLVKAQADAGAHQRMNEYRKLISVGLGGIPPGEVDGMLGTLLETLEQEEPAAAPWANGLASRTVPSV